MYENIPDNPYLLLTPGPLSTSKGVRAALLRDWCTWDKDYNEEIVQTIRRRLVKLATKSPEEYTAVLMQGSGSFAVEACLGSTIPKSGKLLLITNGAYGDRMEKMAEVMGVAINVLRYAETQVPDMDDVKLALERDASITHVAMVHCETTTGILNPLRKFAQTVKPYGKILIIDAMSSFGGIPMDLHDLGIDYLISSANKCIQGVPGFGFVIAKRERLEECEGNARSLSLDLYDQWKSMDESGKWRFTSPTHVVRAFYQALLELKDEGGIAARYGRFCENHSVLVEGMEEAGFETLLPRELQSPIITSFRYPSSDFNFVWFYEEMKQKGYVLYPGKISQEDTFRIGTIGEVFPRDIKKLTETVLGVMK